MVKTVIKSELLWWRQPSSRICYGYQVAVVMVETVYQVAVQLFWCQGVPSIFSFGTFFSSRWILRSFIRWLSSCTFNCQIDKCIRYSIYDVYMYQNWNTYIYIYIQIDAIRSIPKVKYIALYRLCIYYVHPTKPGVLYVAFNRPFFFKLKHISNKNQVCCSVILAVSSISIPNPNSTTHSLPRSSLSNYSVPLF